MDDKSVISKESSPEVTKFVGKNPRIVCAANKYPDGFIAIGPRHFDSTMRDNIHNHIGNEQRKATADLRIFKFNIQNCEQGFIDQYGDYHTRKDAMKIAKANNQIFRECGNKNGDELFSEHLY